MRNRKSTPVSNSNFGFHTTKLTLTQLIDKLSEQLKNLELTVINSPSYLSDRTNLPLAQEEICYQSAQLQGYAQLCGTTNGIAYLVLQEDGKNLRFLEPNEIREYYRQETHLIMERKKCTCDSLCAVAFNTAMEIIKGQPNVTIEICQLKNWSHSLLRFSQQKSNGAIETLFYDPWSQFCFNPSEPKIFSEKELGMEMQNLISHTQMIKPTLVLTELSTFTTVENTDRDFSYCIAHSTGTFTNPSETKPDPTVYPQSTCSIS